MRMNGNININSKCLNTMATPFLQELATKIDSGFLRNKEAVFLRSIRKGDSSLCGPKPFGSNFFSFPGVMASKSMELRKANTRRFTNSSFFHQVRKSMEDFLTCLNVTSWCGTMRDVVCFLSLKPKIHHFHHFLLFQSHRHHVLAAMVSQVNCFCSVMNSVLEAVRHFRSRASASASAKM